MQLQVSPQIKIAVWLLIFIFLIIVSSKLFQGPFSNGIGSVLGISFPTGLFSFTSNFSYVFESNELSKIVQRNLSGQSGEYAIYIEDLNSDESYGFNQDKAFPSASLYKIYLIAAVLKEVDQGNLSLDTTITSSKSHLEDVMGGVDFGYEDSPEKISYTVDEALTRVGRISDNFASIMLAEKVGWDKVQHLADEMGSTKTILKSPIQTSANDIGLFFKKLYQKQVVSENVSDGVIKYLELNQINNRIPAKLPIDKTPEGLEGVKVVHKTGELSRVRHDAGIVILPAKGDQISKKAYVIVLMSKDLQYEDDAIELEANISKDIYDYFVNKQN